MDKKTRPIYMLLPRDSLQTQRHAQSKSQGMEKDISCKQGEKSRCCSICIGQNRLQNKVIRDKEGHYIMIKGSVQQEDIIIKNTYAPYTRSLTYVKQILT